jgi:hypothetical protein
MLHRNNDTPSAQQVGIILKLLRSSAQQPSP